MMAGAHQRGGGASFAARGLRQGAAHALAQHIPDATCASNDHARVWHLGSESAQIIANCRNGAAFHGVEPAVPLGDASRKALADGVRHHGRKTRLTLDPSQVLPAISPATQPNSCTPSRLPWRAAGLKIPTNWSASRAASDPGGAGGAGRRSPKLPPAAVPGRIGQRWRRVLRMSSTPGEDRACCPAHAPLKGWAAAVHKLSDGGLGLSDRRTRRAVLEPHPRSLAYLGRRPGWPRFMTRWVVGSICCQSKVVMRYSAICGPPAGQGPAGRRRHAKARVSVQGLCSCNHPNCLHRKTGRDSSRLRRSAAVGLLRDFLRNAWRRWGRRAAHFRTVRPTRTVTGRWSTTRVEACRRRPRSGPRARWCR